MAMRRDPRLFDASKPLVMARAAPLHEFNMHAGDPLTIVDERADDGTAKKGEVNKDIAIRLWLSTMANYADENLPTAVETPEEYNARVVEMDDLGGGWYNIRAPWIDGAVKVQGKDAATAKRQEIVDKGDTKGVTVELTGGGWYTVTAPWADAPEKIQDEQAANDRAAALIEQGPPAGWHLPTAEEIAAKGAEEARVEAIRAQADADAAAAKEADDKAAAEAEAAKQASDAAGDEQKAADGGAA